MTFVECEYSIIEAGEQKLMKNFIKNVLPILIITVFISGFSTVELRAEYGTVEEIVGTYYMVLKSNSASEETVAGWVIAEYIKGNTNAGEAANILINKYGMLTNYVDEFRAAGIMIDGNEGTSSGSGSGTASQPKPKTEYTVQDVEPYSAWATKDCNIRNGADTTYDKVGSLKKYEKVTVTGVASTGWYRIVTESGLEAYVSNTLVTTEDPSNRTVTVVNENGDEATYEFSDTPPEVIDEIIENIENPKQEHEHSYTETVTTQPTCSSVGTKTYTCEECGDTYTEEIPKTEHVAGEWEITKEPTLTKEGEMVKKCTACGEVLETQKIAPKTNILVGIIAGVVAIILILIGYVVKRKRNK